MAQLGIESVLVAGRGPAACAVIAAGHRLGVKTVAVHSEAERSARHVRLADDAVLLGPAAASESYLAADRILEAAPPSGGLATPPGPSTASSRRPAAPPSPPSCPSRRHWRATPGWPPPSTAPASA